MRARPLILALALLALAPAAAAAQGLGPAAIQNLNAQRAANSIGPVSEHPDLSNGCTNHVKYMLLNPGSPFFGEDPSKPGYTPIGAGEPGSSPVYANGYIALFSTLPPGFNEFGPASNPWLLGPGHLAAMFDPTYALAGYGRVAQADGVIQHCMRLSGFTSRSRTTLAAFTGLEGRKNVPPSVKICCEGPLSPQQAAGLPNNVATGPVITLYAYGPDRVPLKPVSHKLLRGDQKVSAVKFLAGSAKSNNTSSAMHGPASALIPASPLRKNTAYKAILEWKRGTKLLKQVVKFTTGSQIVG